jgi:hypothetical protein
LKVWSSSTTPFGRVPVEATKLFLLILDDLVFEQKPMATPDAVAKSPEATIWILHW